MSLNNNWKYFEKAESNRKTGDNEKAGRYFTLSAYEILGESGLERRDHVVMGIVRLMNAAICYRISDNIARSENRCRQGILIVEDVDSTLYDSEPLHAVSQEFVGDFKLIGQISGYEDHYSQAKEVYSAFEHQSIEWQTQDEFEVGIGPFVHVCQAAGIEFENYGEIRTTSLEARIAAKEQYYQAALDRIIESGVWVWDE